MSDMPDFSKYTLSELEDVYRTVDAAKHPENFKAIVNEIDKKEKECARIYETALSTLKEEDGLQSARRLFQKIIDEYPHTNEAASSSKYLLDTVDKKEHSEQETGKLLPEMNLEFSGSVQEYFRIWIVNLCLTLVTLGFFSAWAKVRKKRYIYSNLSVDNTPFQYLGQPIPILKGRIIAALIFLIYYSSSNFFISLIPYIFAAGLILAPWVFVQSVSFNARYTAFRNITFHFHGSYIEAFKVLSAWGIIPALIIGTLFDWWGHVWIAAILFFVFGILFPWWLRGIKNFIITQTSYGGIPGQFSAKGGEFFTIYFLGGLIIFGFGVITAAFAGISMVFTKNIQYFTIIFTVLTYTGYIVAFAYIQAKITNTVWNQIQLGPVRFNCTLKGWDMVKLYLTNALGIAGSAGLLIPWAVIRTIQYRVEHTGITTDGELTEFRADQEKEVLAVGAELTDFFDMDLSI